MIILIPLDIKPSTTHFETIGRFRTEKDFSLHVLTLRVRVDRKYRTAIVLRLFDNGREYQRYLVAEASNMNKEKTTIDCFNGARVAGLVRGLVDDWTCEYVHNSHDLIWWRSNMGTGYEVEKNFLVQLFGHGDWKGLKRKMYDGIFEPVADETDGKENSDLTEEKKEDSIKEAMEDIEKYNAFTAYINSSEWKHDA